MSLARYLSKLGSLVGSNGKVPTAGIDDLAVTAAKLHTTAVTDKLGYTPTNKNGDTLYGQHHYDGGLMISAASGTGIARRTFAVAKGELWDSGSTYVHILLPARYNSSGSRMFQLLIQGYALDVPANRNINLMISGYVTTISNGGPISSISAWDATGQYSPTAYYSSGYSRGIARFYLSSKYYHTFVVDAIQAGNGDVIAPGECSVIYSSASTI